MKRERDDKRVKLFLSYFYDFLTCLSYLCKYFHVIWRCVFFLCFLLEIRDLLRRNKTSEMVSYTFCMVTVLDF